METQKTEKVMEKKPSIWKKWFTGKEGEFKLLAPNYVCFGGEKTPKIYDYGKPRCYVKKAIRIARWAIGVIVIVAFILFLLSMLIDIDYVITGIAVVIVFIGLVVWIITLIIDRVSKEENIYRNLIIIGVVVVLVWIIAYFLFRT